MTTQTFRARLLACAALAASLGLAAPARPGTRPTPATTWAACRRCRHAIDDGDMPDRLPGHAPCHGQPAGRLRMTRDASGTSWQPDASPHDGIMVHTDSGWMLMGHALFNGVYDSQGGPRGGDKTFLAGMVMGMAQRPLGEGNAGLQGHAQPRPVHGQERLSAAAGHRRDGRRPDPAGRPPAPARPLHGAVGQLQPSAGRRLRRLSLCRPAGRAGVRPAGLHAPPGGHGQPRGPDHPPLVRLDPHHLRRGDGRGCRATTGRSRPAPSAAASRTSIATTSRPAGWTASRPGCRGTRRRTGPCRPAGRGSTAPRPWSPTTTRPAPRSARSIPARSETTARSAPPWPGPARTASPATPCRPGCSRAP
jgi:hypothetical protein